MGTFEFSDGCGGRLRFDLGPIDSGWIPTKVTFAVSGFSGAIDATIPKEQLDELADDLAAAAGALLGARFESLEQDIDLTLALDGCGRGRLTAVINAPGGIATVHIETDQADVRRAAADLKRCLSRMSRDPSA